MYMRIQPVRILDSRVWYARCCWHERRIIHRSTHSFLFLRRVESLPLHSALLLLHEQKSTLVQRQPKALLPCIPSEAKRTKRFARCCWKLSWVRVLRFTEKSPRCFSLPLYIYAFITKEFAALRLCACVRTQCS